MKSLLLPIFAALASLAALAGGAATPEYAFLSASRKCSVTSSLSGASTTYDLSTASAAPNGETWYGGSDRTFLKAGSRFTASVTGYLTSWYSYETAPQSLREHGPSHLTQLLGSESEITFTESTIGNLYGRYAASETTDLYAKFTPITYKLAYELNGGSFTSDGSHPATATYDQSFTVSAPVRDFYRFTGWKVGSKSYFNGESNDVTMINLTTTDGATVSIGATWTGRTYPLYLSLGDGVAKIHYRTSASSAWLETASPLTVQVAYGESWSAWAEAQYGWEGSGSGWDAEGVTGGTMTEKGDRFKPEAVRKKFTVTAKPSPADGGSVTGSGTYEYETQVELAATAAKGHSFAGWSTGANENPLNISVLSATNVTANFSRNSYALTLTVPEGVSNVWYRIGGEGEFTPVTDTCRISVPYGAKYACYATTLYGWSLSGIGSSEENLWSGTMPDGDLAFVPEPTRNTYRVQLGVTPAGAGSVSGAGSYEYQALAYLAATPAAGYRFTGWSDGSAENPYWYPVAGDAVLTARFAAKTYALELIVGEGVARICYRLQTNDVWTAWASTDVTTTVEVPYETRYQLYAETKPGYVISGTGSSAGSPVTGTVRTDGVIYEPKPSKAQYRVVLSADPVGAGSVSGSGTFLYGETATLQAVPNEGYRFASWSDGSEESPHLIEVFCATNLTAHFAQKTYALQLIVGEGVEKIHYQLKDANDDWSAWAEVSGDTTIDVPYGTSYRVYADAKSGYELTGSGSSIGSAVTGTMKTDGFIFAPVATKKAYTVVAVADPSEGGTILVQPVGKFSPGEMATVSLTVKEGYLFQHWNRYVGNVFEEDVSDDPDYTFEVTDSVSLVAVLAKDQFTVVFKCRGESGDWVDYEQTVAYGESTVEPPAEQRNNWPGHTFVSWSSDGWKSVKSDLVITAQYADGGYTVSFNANGGTGAKMLDETFTCGQAQTLTKCSYTAPAGYKFAGWSKDLFPLDAEYRVDYTDGQEVRDITTSDSITLYAVWEPITYTIVFDPDESKGGEGTMPFLTLKYNESRQLPKCMFMNGSVEFSGWLYNDSTYGDQETVSRLTTKDEDTITFVAQWGGTRSVTFYPNYAGAEQICGKKTQPFAEGVENALRTNTFTRTGYTFAGWSTDPAHTVDAESLRVASLNGTKVTARYNSDGSTVNVSETLGNDDLIADQALVTDPASAGKTLDLYAIWKPNTYQVIFDANEHQERYIPLLPQILQYDQPFTNVLRRTETSTTGEKFYGWGRNRTGLTYKCVEGEEAAANVHVPLLNLTPIPNDHIRLYAIWSDTNPTNEATANAAKKLSLTTASSETATPAPQLAGNDNTTTSNITWNQGAWKKLPGDCYLNEKDEAALVSKDKWCGGALCFLWMPTGANATDRKNTSIKVYHGDQLLATIQAATGEQQWYSVSNSIPTTEAQLKILADAGTKGEKPCMISNIYWTAGQPSTLSNTIYFECGENVSWTQAPSSQSITNGAEITFPKAETLSLNEGCLFAGWTLSSTEGVLSPACDASGYVTNATGRRVQAGETITVTTSDTGKELTFTAVATNSVTPAVTATFIIDEEMGARIGGGEATQKLSVIENYPPVALEPTVVGIKGWEFDGWNRGERAASTGGMPDIAINGIAGEELSENATFVAHFSPHVYHVLYANAHGNTNPNPDTFVLTNGWLTFTQDKFRDLSGESYAYADLLNIAETAHGAFKEWSPKALKADAYQWVDEKAYAYVYHNPLTQAQWETMTPVTNFCTVTFLSGADWSVRTVITNEYGKSVDPSRQPPGEPVPLGYEFSGWDQPLGNVTADLTTKAIYTLRKSPITYTNLRGATHDNPAEYDITFFQTGDTWHDYRLNDPANDNINLAFRGWSAKDNSGQTCFIQDSLPYRALTNDIPALTLSANWAYRVTYSRTDGDHIASIEGQKYETSRNVNHYLDEGVGSTNAPAVVCRPGYSFAGWLVTEPVDTASLRALADEDGFLIDAEGLRVTTASSVISNVTQAISLQAVATANVYCVTFDGNGAESGGGAWTNQWFTYDVVQALNKNEYAKTDLCFVGWSGAPGMRVLPDGEVVQNLATGGVVTLSAVWTNLPCVVTFKKGSHVLPAETVRQYAVVGGTVTLPAVTTETGYLLKGWRVDADVSSASAGAASAGIAFDSEGFLIDAAGLRVYGGSLTNVTSSLSLTAVATANVFLVTIDGVATNVAYGETLTHTVPASVTNVDETVNVVCTGWVGSGSVPASGSSNAVTFVVTNATSLTWLYATNFWVSADAISASAEGRGEVAASTGEATSTSLLKGTPGTVALWSEAGAPAANPGWYLSGTNLVATATPAEGWLFAGWREEKAGEESRSTEDGQTSSIQQSNNPTIQQSPTYAFTVLSPVSLTAVFTQQVCTVTIDGVATDVFYGETLTHTVPASVTNEEGTVNVVCTGWVGSGSVPASGSSNAVTFVVTNATSLTWLYATNFWVSVDATSTGEATSTSLLKGTPGTVALWSEAGAPAANPGWYLSGTNLVATATPAEGWLFAGWRDEKVGEESRSTEDGPTSSIQQSNNPTIQQSPTYAFTVLSPVSLTAVFTQKTYTVVFVLDPHLTRTGGGALVQSVAHGESATLPTVKAAAGCTFAGWFDADGNPVDAESLRVITADRTVYGRVMRSTFDVTVAVAEGCEKMGTVSGGKTNVKPGTKMTIRASAKSGYVFSGWYPVDATSAPLSQSASYSFVMPAEDVSLEARFLAKADDWAEVSVGEMPDDFPKDAAIVPIDVTAKGGSLPTLKVTGLPTGLKFTTKLVTSKVTTGTGKAKVTTLVTNALPNQIYGTPTKAGTFTATVTATTAGKATATEKVTFVIVDLDLASVRASVDGWALLEDAGRGVTPASTEAETNVSVGVYLQWPVAASALSDVKTVSVSGLPSGLKFTAKPITAKVTSYDAWGVRVTTVVTNVPAMTIYGTPTAASKTDLYGDVVPSTVKVAVTTAGKSKATGVLLVAVEALPTALVGSYTGGETNAPAGSATVTLAKTGKISGKWVSEGQTWTLAATGFERVVRQDAAPTGADGRVYIATNVTAKCGREVETLTLVFGVNDLGYGEVTASSLFSATYVPWKTDAELKALATKLKGETFIVASDDGITLSGKVGAAGVVSVKGAFDIGAKSPYTATVSATLVPVDADRTRFELFLYWPPVKNKLPDGYATRIVLAWDGEILEVMQ